MLMALLTVSLVVVVGKVEPTWRRTRRAGGGGGRGTIDVTGYLQDNTDRVVVVGITINKSPRTMPSIEITLSNRRNDVSLEHSFHMSFFHRETFSLSDLLPCHVG